MNNILLSLCIPTNGVIEWVFPVLDSIYAQKVDESLFEVVITNNGNNEEFEVQMQTYLKKYHNIVYKKTNAYMFNNQLEALKLASGRYLKLINHRAIFKDGAIEYFLKIIEEKQYSKPIMYFSNGVLGRDYNLSSFDEFVYYLGKYASWTTGVGIWKSDYDNLPTNLKIDKISPHSCILFAKRYNDTYEIIDYSFSEEIEKEHTKKGNYDLFKAFAIEEVSIIQNLYIDGNISVNTLKKVMKDYRDFVADLYFDFMIRKKPCSYNLSGFDDSMGVYFSKIDIKVRAYFCFFKKIVNKLRG